jgi:hypothetical protein
MIGLVIDEGLSITITDELSDINFPSENLISNSKPYGFIKDVYWNKLKNVCFFDKSIHQASKHNFRIELSEITAFDNMVDTNSYFKIPLCGTLFLSTHLSDIKLDKPIRTRLYSRAANYARLNTRPIRKKMFVIQNQATNFDATYTAVRNWLLEQNFSVDKNHNIDSTDSQA